MSSPVHNCVVFRPEETAVRGSWGGRRAAKEGSAPFVHRSFALQLHRAAARARFRPTLTPARLREAASRRFDASPSRGEVPLNVAAFRSVAVSPPGDALARGPRLTCP